MSERRPNLATLAQALWIPIINGWMFLQNPCEVLELVIYVANLVHLINMLQLEGGY